MTLICHHDRIRTHTGLWNSRLMYRYDMTGLPIMHASPVSRRVKCRSRIQKAARGTPGSSASYACISRSLRPQDYVVGTRRIQRKILAVHTKILSGNVARASQFPRPSTVSDRVTYHVLQVQWLRLPRHQADTLTMKVEYIGTDWVHMLLAISSPVCPLLMYEQAGAVICFRTRSVA